MIFKDVKNPFILSSGPSGNFQELSEIINLNKIGAITTKTITPEPKKGNPAPRIINIENGLINSIGLQNPGIEKFMENELPEIEKYQTKKIISIAGYSPKDFKMMIEKINGFNIDAYELNFSCPNVNKGGATIMQNLDLYRECIKVSKESTIKPLIIKLGYSDRILNLVEISINEGVKNFTLINTLKGMKFDLETGKPLLKRGVGGVSGNIIKPFALAMIYTVKQKYPEANIIANGGIFDTEDVLEFKYAGADYYGLGTAVMMDPELPIKIIKNWEEKYVL
ncbi:MAG: dihydroorotate dehydrogenase [Thermotogota bacterium]